LVTLLISILEQENFIEIVFVIGAGILFFINLLRLTLKKEVKLETGISLFVIYKTDKTA